MNFKDLGKFLVQKGLPIVGAALSGGNPLTVAAMIANAFNANPSDPADIINKINLDPNSQIKLLELQQTHEIELTKLALQAEIENNKDRASARQREVDIAKAGQRDWMPAILATLIVLGFFSVLYAIMTTAGDPTDKDVLNIMLGVLGAQFAAVYSYYFGSSASSRNKDSAMIESIKAK
jgi:hypothetical protein